MYGFITGVYCCFKDFFRILLKFNDTIALTELNSGFYCLQGRRSNKENRDKSIVKCDFWLRKNIGVITMDQHTFFYHFQIKKCGCL